MASLRALECLVAVADSGSITEAARLLYLSQPAVSHQLALLERETGTPLLREPRGVRLTPAGRAALTDARRAVESAESAVRSARSVGAADGGTLRLAAAQSLVSVLAPVMTDWHLSHPDVLLTLREATAVDVLLGFIEVNAVDFVLMPPPATDRFVVTEVAEEEIVVVAPTDHPFAGRPVVTIKELDGLPLVHFAHENGLSGWLDRCFAEAGVRPVPVMRSAVSNAVPQLAAAGLGVAVCPVSAVGGGSAGIVRRFSPRWVRPLAAVTAGEPDTLSARFIADLRRHGVEVPPAVSRQLEPPTAGAILNRPQ